jgi:hypothetical protein
LCQHVIGIRRRSASLCLLVPTMTVRVIILTVSRIWCVHERWLCPADRAFTNAGFVQQIVRSRTLALSSRSCVHINSVSGAVFSMIIPYAKHSFLRGSSFSPAPSHLKYFTGCPRTFWFSNKCRHVFNQCT